MTTRSVLLAALVLAIALTVALGGPTVGGPGDSGTTTGESPSPIEPTAAVTFADENGTELGTAAVAVADTPDARYQGLSNTAPLAPDTGMLFVYDDEANRTFVMRQMNYPIDIVFVGSDGRVTTIHHAETEANDDPGDDLTPYPGRGKWVVEVPYGWTSEHGVEVGDEIEITYT